MQPENTTVNRPPDHPSEQIAKLTPAQAQDLFQMKVAEIQKTSGCDYVTAFNRAKILNQQLFAQIGEDKGVSTPERIKADSFTLGNTSEIPPFPVFNPPTKTLLGLPADADQTEYETAWRATRGITTPRDSQAIWKMLSALWGGRKSGEPKLMIERFMKERFPLLASSVSNS